jgi:opacity protein-like surface antigen
VRPYGFLGPNLGILLSATNKIEVTGNAGGGGETDLKSFTSGTDFALDFGGGAEFNIIPKLAITGDVRYSLGLGDINNTPAQAGQTATKLTTGGFQILLGAMFHIM